VLYVKLPSANPPGLCSSEHAQLWWVFVFNDFMFVLSKDEFADYGSSPFFVGKRKTK